MLPVAVLLVGLGGAVLARQVDAVRARLSTASTTILALLGAALAGLPLLAGGGGWGVLLPAAAGTAALVALGAVVNARWLTPLRERSAEGPTVAERVESWAERHHVGPRGTNLLAVVVGSWRRAIDVRVTGLAAEMTYYGLISLVPLLTALGASLGFLERLVGAEAVTRIEDSLVDAVSTVFAEQVASDVLAPLIEGLLGEERAGVAVGSVLVALWLASRMFRAAIRALDDAYRVPERRGLVGQYALGIALALGAVITLLVILALVVIGPLLGDGQEIADQLGLGVLFQVSWSVLRWPALAVVTTTYLTIVYRYGPNITTTWRRCLPGAAIGTVGLVLVSVGFSAYLRLAGPGAPGGENVEGAAVTAAAQAIGLVLAGVVWLWLSSIVTLAGGVVNAELARAQRTGGGGGVPPPLSRRRR
ncbi:YihY/virulence factor BrkB family protein [Georgenia satyanarayanai]|uniref:YihY/virulence factor BrkB family protein n=1 Tax=Georgenia satyanarayanai TaxID=860221 RepID=UPI0020426076|nr:YihY/virulence factor BrkB family protein [Georgenia satyanarayanai]MCM3662096.1 YihY/virulence factor BrkB family protein [Georgenia satyanarayanai]